MVKYFIDILAIKWLYFGYFQLFWHENELFSLIFSQFSSKMGYFSGKIRYFLSILAHFHSISIKG